MKNIIKSHSFFKSAFLWTSVIPLGLLIADCFIHSKDFTIIAFFFGLVYSSLLFCGLYRHTYRILPNLFLAGAFFVFFIILLSVLHNDKNHNDSYLLGFGILNSDLIALFITDDFTKWLGWSILGTVLATIVTKATEDIWYGFGRNTTDDYSKVSYRFKQQRRRLLTYRGKIITPLGIIMIAYLVMGLATVLFLFIKQSGDVLRLLSALFFIGAALAVVGFILHQFITDDHLLRCEKSLILDRRADSINSLKKVGPKQANWEWSSFRQVLSNAFCSRSPIMYENDQIHDLKIIPEPKANDACHARIIADCTQSFQEISTLYCIKEATSEKLALELQFAEEIAAYLDSVKDVVTNKPDYLIVHYISLMFDSFFCRQDLRHPCMKHWVRVPYVPFEGLRKLLIMDYLCQLTSRLYTHLQCPIFWLCFSNGENAQSVTSECSKHTSCNPKRKLCALILEFPFMVEYLLRERWGKDISATEHTDFEHCMQEATIYYYEQLKSHSIIKALYSSWDDDPSFKPSVITEYRNYLLSLEPTISHTLLLEALNNHAKNKNSIKNELSASRTRHLQGSPIVNYTQYYQQNISPRTGMPNWVDTIVDWIAC